MNLPPVTKQQAIDLKKIGIEKQARNLRSKKLPLFPKVAANEYAESKYGAIKEKENKAQINSIEDFLSGVDWQEKNILPKFFLWLGDNNATFGRSDGWVWVSVPNKFNHASPALVFQYFKNESGINFDPNINIVNKGENKTWKSMSVFWALGYDILIDGTVVNKRGKKIMPVFKDYTTVNISLNGSTKTCQIHRLLACKYIPNPNDYPIVNHKDGNKMNNSIENLEWCTYSHNASHAYKNGLRKKRCPAIPKQFNSKPKSIIKILDGNIVETYPSLLQAEKITGYPASSIKRWCEKSMIKNGFLWQYEHAQSAGLDAAINILKERLK